MQKTFFTPKKNQLAEIFQNLPQPSEEAIKKSKLLIEQLKERLNKEGVEKFRRDVLRCSVGQ